MKLPFFFNKERKNTSGGDFLPGEVLTAGYADMTIEAEGSDKNNDGLKKVLIIILSVLTVLTVTFSSLCLFSEKWMTSTWSALSFEEMLYQLSTPLDGTENSMMHGFIFNGAAPAVIMMFFTIILLLFLKNKKRVVYVCISLGLILLSVIMFLAALISAWIFLDMSAYLGDSEGDFVLEKYVDPAETEMTFPSRKRNLVYIFMESMEMTYSDRENGGAFDYNCIPELTKLSEENENFSGDPSVLNGGISFPGATWTMGGIFAQTSGLPLKISIGENQMNTQSTFFPTITTLGDILKDQGYKNEFLLGSDATFGGRRLYFGSHGSYDIKDLLYARQQGWLAHDYAVFWGFEDYHLVDFARNELDELGNSGQPFNFSMLTVDTHFEDGYLCPYCEDEFDEPYANVMACSSKQVSELVRWIQQQDWYENTTIVLCGDHPTMDSDFCDEVPSDYQRRVFTTIINGAAEKEYDEAKARLYSTMDMFPTTLAALGVDIEGDRLGLGTNLYSDEDTYTEIYGVRGETTHLQRKSDFMTKLADLDESQIKDPTAKSEFSVSNDRKRITVIIDNVLKNGSVVNNTQLKIWSGDDDSDAIYLDLPRNDKQQYSIALDLESYYEKDKLLHMEAYLVEASGKMYRVGYDVLDPADADS